MHLLTSGVFAVKPTYVKTWNYIPLHGLLFSFRIINDFWGEFDINRSKSFGENRCPQSISVRVGHHITLAFRTNRFNLKRFITITIKNIRWILKKSLKPDSFTEHSIIMCSSWGGSLKKFGWICTNCSKSFHVRGQNSWTYFSKSLTITISFNLYSYVGHDALIQKPRDHYRQVVTAGSKVQLILPLNIV